MGITDKIKEFIAPIDDDEVLELNEEEAQAISKYESVKSRAVSNASFDTKMVLFEPRSFDELGNRSSSKGKQGGGSESSPFAA